MARPLLAPYHDTERFPPAAGSSPSRRVVPLLALVLTQRSHETRRAWQRETWLSFGWHERGSDALVPWRYAYFSLASSNASSSRAGELLGDVVTLPRRRGKSVSGRALGALEWAMSHVHFESALIVDDTSLVHVGRVWEWLRGLGPVARAGSLYAGAADGARRCGDSALILGRGAAETLLAAADKRRSAARGVADLAGVKYRCTTWPWSARSVGELLSPHRGLSEAAVLAESVDIIQKTFELGAAQSQFLRQPACALVYGVDFVLDARGRPMLLEVQTNPSTNNKEEFECFNQTAAFDALMRASLAFDAHEESAELIPLRTDAIEAMRQEARGRRSVMRRREAPAAEWPSACRNFSR